VVAKGDATVHTPRGLSVQFLVGPGVDILVVVIPSFLYRTFGRQFAVKFKKSGWLAHEVELWILVREPLEAARPKVNN
jgi:hypothetical protein